MRLRILHTNDVHSNFSDFYKVATYIDKNKDENTIVVDGGDFCDFKALEMLGTSGIGAGELLSEAGYNVAAIGNNETFNGRECLKGMIDDSRIPYISCNLKNIDGSDIDGLRNSIILVKNNVRVLLIGISPDMGKFYELEGLKADENIVKTVKREIEDNYGLYDFCVVLSHQGTKRDRELAENLGEIDIIINAHDHVLSHKPESVNGVIMNSAGAFGKHVGLIEVEKVSGEVKLIKGETASVENEESKESVIKTMGLVREAALKVLEKEIFRVDYTLWHDVFEENPATNLIADALNDMLDVDFGIINSGILNGGIKKGAVSEKKLLEISPSPLNPTTYKIKGKDIIESMNQTLDTQKCGVDGKGPGFRGKYLGRLHVSDNVKVRYNGRKVFSVTINESEVEMERWYKIGTTDYLHRGSGYTAMGNNIDEVYFEGFIKDLLREYLQKEPFIIRAYIDRFVDIEDDVWVD